MQTQEKGEKDIENSVKNTAKSYKNYYEEVLVKEQPFYHSGMTQNEAREELEYLNNHLEEFYSGTYQPLWKQNNHI